MSHIPSLLNRINLPKLSGSGLHTERWGWRKMKPLSQPYSALQPPNWRIVCMELRSWIYFHTLCEIVFSFAFWEGWYLTFCIRIILLTTRDSYSSLRILSLIAFQIKFPAENEHAVFFSGYWLLLPLWLTFLFADRLTRFWVARLYIFRPSFMFYFDPWVQNV